MSSSRSWKAIVDFLMMACLLLALAYQLTGNTAHEYLGLIALLLFILHNGLNRSWYAHLYKGVYRWRRSLSLLINLLLGALMAGVILTGLLSSHAILPRHWPIDGLLLRKLHTLSSYWGLVLMAAHLGLHGDRIQASLTKPLSTFRLSRSKAWRGSLLLGAGLLLGAAGLISASERGLWGKLLLGDSFDTWDPQRPAILFFGANLAIVLCLAGLTHLLLRLTHWALRQGRLP